GDASVAITGAALVAGEWRCDGPWVERVGPYCGKVVSRAPVAGPADIAATVRYARQHAAVVGRLSPAARATVLARASEAAVTHRDGLARLLALELGKPVKDGLG